MDISQTNHTVITGDSELFLNRDLDAILPISIIDNALVYTRRRPGKSTANEDSTGVVRTTDTTYLMVADGLGGLPEGAAASRETILHLSECLAGKTAEEPIAIHVNQAVESANSLLLAHDDGRATTLSLLAIRKEKLYSFHAGDSYSLVSGQQGKVKLLTTPHSPVGEDQARGLLTEIQAMHHAERNIVSNVIGSKAMYIEASDEIYLAPRDTILISSDGLFDNLYTNEIVEIIRAGSLQESAEELLKTTSVRMKTRQHHPSETPSHPDDLTFILYRPNGAY